MDQIETLTIKLFNLISENALNIFITNLLFPYDYLYKLVNSMYYLTSNRLILLSNILNISLDYFFNEDSILSYTILTNSDIYKFSSNLKHLNTIKKNKRFITLSNKYLKENKFPPIILLCQMSKFYNCSLDFLIGRTDVFQYN